MQPSIHYLEDSIRVVSNIVTAEILVAKEQIDEETLNQVKAITELPTMVGSHPVIMPDCHLGVGAVVGFTQKITKYIHPQFVGVDIGCGVLAVNLGKIDVKFGELDDFIRSRIPLGFKKHDKIPASVFTYLYGSNLARRITNICSYVNAKPQDVFCSLGTLGGGNHFIEIDVEPEGNVWLTIHTGSRNFGLRIANFWIKEAKRFCTDNFQSEQLLKTPYLPVEHLGSMYLEDVNVAQSYAAMNRNVIANTIASAFFAQNYDKLEKISSVHNYVDPYSDILRKGAVASEKGRKLVIPLNSAEGIVIGEGIGKRDWNYSAPHGLGRSMSRTKAKQNITVDDYIKSMEHVWSSSVGRGTLDEAPAAYKDSARNMPMLSRLIAARTYAKPVYNIKGGS